MPDEVIVEVEPDIAVVAVPAAEPIGVVEVADPVAVVEVMMEGPRGPVGNIAVGQDPPDNPEIGDLWVPIP